jgi:hypothetical protein
MAETNYPGLYQQLGATIIEAKSHFGNGQVVQFLREQGIDGRTMCLAVQIARRYSYEQAVQFPSLRAIMQTIPNIIRTVTNNREQMHLLPADCEEI